MNNQKIVRVCQCCYHILDGNDMPTGEKWDKVAPATHGQCRTCTRGMEKFGNDRWIDMTEKER